MINFDWDKFKNGKVAVHCDTEGKALDFINECREIGLTWCDISKLEGTEWDKYEMETCYDYAITGGIALAITNYYKSKNYKIIEWEIEKDMNKEFSKADLKSGMVFELRNKERYIVVTKTTAIGNGFVKLLEWKDDLTYDGNGNEKYDIVKVFNIQEDYKCLPKNLHLARNLLWERKELKEMTIEDIQKELGYKIKIVEK